MVRALLIGVWRLAILLATASLEISSQTTTFTIAGHVVRHTDSRPVKAAQVLIYAVGHPERQLVSASDENGAFLFSGLAQGKYSLAVSYRGWSQSFKQLDEYSTAIVVGPGFDSEHILFPLNSPASIVGSVVDEDGDPVPGATVFLFGRSVVRGVSQIGLKETAGSGSDGSFHFAHLAPGTYYVAVIGRPWYTQNLPVVQGVPPDQAPQTQANPRSALDLAYPLTYYPDSASPAGATPLKLQDGGRVEIQFNLHPVPALHIALDGVDKKPDQQIQTSLSQIGPGGARITLPFMLINSEMTGIAPGDYVLTVTLSGQNQSSIIGSQAVSLTSDTTVHLGDAIKTSVNGKVILVGDVPRRLAVLLRNVTTGDAPWGPVAHDGSFEIAQELQPGRYDLSLLNTPDLYMRAVTAKGGVYSNGELEIRTGAHIELTITAGRGLSKVDGVVVNDHKPAAGAMVLLLPQDLSHGKHIRRDQSDSDGTFTLYSAPPGRYTLVAIDDGRDLEYADPAAMAPYLSGGRVIDLPLPTGAPLEIELQPRK